MNLEIAKLKTLDGVTLLTFDKYGLHQTRSTLDDLPNSDYWFVAKKSANITSDRIYLLEQLYKGSANESTTELVKVSNKESNISFQTLKALGLIDLTETEFVDVTVVNNLEAVEHTFKKEKPW